MGLLLLASTIQGCSFIGVHGPSRRPPPSCTQGYGRPIGDTLGAGLLMLPGIALADAGASASDRSARVFGEFFGGVLIAQGVVLAVSAIYGYTLVGQCRTETEAMIQNAPPPPPVYIPPPAGAPPGWQAPGYAPPPPGQPLPPPPVYTPDQFTAPSRTPGWQPYPVSKPHS